MVGALSFISLLSEFTCTVCLKFSNIKNKNKNKSPKIASLICSKPSHISLLAQSKNRKLPCGQQGSSILSPRHLSLNPLPWLSLSQPHWPQGLCSGCCFYLDCFSPCNISWLTFLSSSNPSLKDLKSFGCVLATLSETSSRCMAPHSSWLNLWGMCPHEMKQVFLSFFAYCLSLSQNVSSWRTRSLVCFVASP